MKKSLITTLVAIPLLSLSSLSFAAEPVQLTVAQMDSVTAGFFNYANIARVVQLNASPVTVVQLSALNGGALSGNNAVAIVSGNSSHIHQ